MLALILDDVICIELEIVKLKDKLVDNTLHKKPDKYPC